jgi:hypothetical protein
MPAAIHDLIRDKGETRNIIMTDKGAGLPIDLTGSFPWLEINDAMGLVCSFTLANFGILLTDPVNGNFEIDLSMPEYAALATGVYSYRMMIVPPNGESRMMMRGKWTIR